MKRRRWIAMALCGTMLAGVLAGCGGGGAQESSSAEGGDAAVKDTIVFSDDEWYGTDPYQQDTWSSIQSLISDPLFTLDPATGDLLDGICTDLTVSEDGLTMTATVPEGKYYATGEQVEPEDVVASIEWGKEVSPYADGYANIESMEVDGRNVIFHLSTFRSDLLYYLGECFMGVIDKDQLDTMSKDELMWGAVPYGLYYVESYEPGTGVTLAVNEGYKADNPLVTNKGPAQIPHVEVKFNSNQEEFTILEELKAGDIDYVNRISADGRAQLEGMEGFQVVNKTYPIIQYFELNTDEGSIFADPNVRLAMILSIDRDALCELVDGAAVPGYSIIFDSMKNFSQAAKDDFMENYANDPERAQQLLADAGWTDSDGDGYLDKDGQPLEFTFYVDSTGTSQTIVQGLQEQMKNAGFLMNIETVDWNYIHEYIHNDEYDAGLQSLEWAEPILILNACYYDQDAPGNDEAYYAAVEDAAETVDGNERTEKIGQIQMDMFKNCNIIPFFSNLSYIAYGDQVKGIVVQSDSSLYWNDLSF